MNPKRVAIIGTDYPELEKHCPNWYGMQVGLKRLGVDYRFFSCRPELNIKEVIGYNPDLMIYGLRDMVLRSDWRRQLREGLHTTTIVIWYGDYRSEKTGQYDANCSEVQAMFISNDDQEEYYKRKWKVPKVHFLPLACEPITKPQFDKNFAFDFVFIGGAITGGPFYERHALISNMRYQYGLTVVNSFEEKLRSKIFQAMPRIYSSSKVTLDVSHFTDIPGYTSIRYWEIPAFYGFSLTKRWPGCEQYYPEGSRAYFDTLEEAIEKRNYYLTHESERKAMRERAHLLSSRHTYKERFTEMFSKL